MSSTSKVQWKVPGVATASSSSSSGMKKKTVKRPSCLKTTIEVLLFLVWLFFTGLAGYYFGYDPNAVKCADPSPTTSQQLSRPAAIPITTNTVPEVKCEEVEEGDSEDGNADGETEEMEPSSLADLPPLFKEDGYSFQELKDMWSCSQAVGNISQVNKDLLPEDTNLEKTKWKSILTVEPKAFFEKYLSQYPADTRAVQPVVVFSHKELKSFEEISEVCKVLDIAVVPDKPGVCVAVTETYHDVASYHMLHAERQPDGAFALTSNYIDGRKLPEESQYASARALLLDFFKYGEKVQEAMKLVPRYGKGKVAVGVLVEDAMDTELFLNSFKSASNIGVSKNKFAVFTTQQSVYDDLHKTGIKVVFMPDLANVGISGDANVGPKLRRYFLQTWFGFAAANALLKMMWQTPGTIWFERPDNIIQRFPAVETLWSFKGRKDGRAAPFFISYDFFVALGVERPVHLLHELILHFDLIMAWDSLDAVAAYRLTENNSR